MPRPIVLTVLLAFALAACGGSSGSENTVEMTSAQLFDPDAITVTAGTMVTWSNDDAQTHTVTAYDDGVPNDAYFASGDMPDEAAARDDLQASLLAEGDTYEVTFDEPGTYRYFCIPHEQQGMKGEIVVEP
ncbi:MAG: plastocyanin/azurin family copper-binding protein [Actinomycetota bacterium]|nr:plastocyanin/azurin family copper-binding protein [Actinomycetota bacterium]